MEKNKLIKKIWWLCSAVNRWVERFSAFLHIIIIFIVLIICSQAVAFSIVYLQLLSEKDINMICFQYINIWSILPSNEITNELIYSNFDDVKMRIEFLMNISIALSGKDDVQIMCDFFKGANFVAIYSHSFGWLKKSAEIREVLTELSNKNKLKLYTGDDLDSVKTRLQNDCDTNLIKCIQKSEISLRFSYIERNNAKYLLYRQEEEKHIYVISVRENSESQYLLQVISQLVK